MTSVRRDGKRFRVIRATKGGLVWCSAKWEHLTDAERERFERRRKPRLLRASRPRLTTATA